MTIVVIIFQKYSYLYRNYTKYDHFSTTILGNLYNAPRYYAINMDD